MPDFQPPIPDKPLPRPRTFLHLGYKIRPSISLRSARQIAASHRTAIRTTAVKRILTTPFAMQRLRCFLYRHHVCIGTRLIPQRLSRDLASLNGNFFPFIS